jgi:uncharacterized protein
MEQQTTSVGPVSLSERILFIDVLRGMALFGILAANMRAFFGPLDIYGEIGLLFHSRADVWAQGLVDMFFQGKFISIFSFLFGLGFAIQLSRAEAKGVRFLSFYPRRLLALALFGLIHGIFIWAGDILLTYAFSGAILLLFRKRQQSTLLWWAGSLFALPIVIASTLFTLYHTRFRPQWMNFKPTDMHKIYAIVNIYAHGTVRQIMAQNWVEWKQELPTTLFAIYATALFLLGMWVWRAGIVMNLYVATVWAIAPDGKISVWIFLANVLHFPAAHILAAGYISGLALIFLNKDWRRFVLPFAAVGRTALTNYLLESVVCTLFFYNYTTGLYGRVGPAVGLALTVILFAAQVGLSNLWLKHYRFGPMEWLWRGMTYGKFPSMRHEKFAPEIEEAVLAPSSAAALSKPNEVA